MFRRLMILSLLCFFGGSPISFSQAKIDFLETTFDFGQIEEGVVAEHDFVFTNNGDQPLILSSVKASCGCTTPAWTKNPIQPGDQGHIKASYNSKNRPGGFHKSITVTSNASTPSKVIYIKGITAKSHQLKPLFTAEELKNAPRAEITQQHLQLGKVQIGSSLPVNLTIQNQGKSPLEIKGIYSSCRCINLMPTKNLVIEPNSKGLLELIFTPTVLGESTYGAYILSNDLIQPKYQIYLTSSVVPQQDKSSLVKEAPAKITF
jgi:hypothetical protein